MSNENTTSELPVPTPNHPYIANTLQVDINAVLPLDLMDWLLKERNPCNRPITKARVKQYTQAILDGTWDENAGNSIRFDTDGNILDGQHRIAAFLASNAPMKTIAIYGIPAKSMRHIDENVPRNAATRSLLGKGEKPTRLAVKFLTAQFGIARLWIQSQNNFKNPVSATGGNSRICISMDMLDDLIAQKGQYIISAMAIGENSDVRRVGYRTAVAQYFEKDAVKAEEFHKSTAGDGANLASDSPVLWLRKYLSKVVGGGGSLIKQDYRATLTAIHKFHNNQPCPKLCRANNFQEKWDF